MERADFEQWSAKEVSRLLALVETGRRYYQEIVATAPVGLLVISGDLTQIMANRRFREIFAVRPEEEIPKQTLMEVLPNETVHRVVQEVFATGQPARNVLVDMGEGEQQRTFRFDVFAIRAWDAERDVEALVFVDEVTKVKVEGPPRAPQPQFANDFPAIFWEAEPSTRRFTYVSPAAEGILGYRVEEWLEREEFWGERIHPEDRGWMQEFYQSAAAAPRGQECEYRALGKDGSTVWLREIVQPVGVNGGLKLTGMALDTTARRQMEEQRIQAAKFDALGRFTNKAGHEFNNLQMIISGYANELGSALAGDESLRLEVEELRKAAERLSGLTRQLLAYSRRIPVQSAAFDLGALLRARAAKLRPELGADVELEIVGGPESVEVETDQGRTEQAVSEVVRHANGRMARGGRIVIELASMDVPAHAASCGGALKPGAYAQVTVTDSGDALDAGTLARIFEPLPGEDQGAGLANVYRFFRQIGGDMIVTSEPRRGTSVRMYLPGGGRIIPEPEAAIATEAAPPAAQEAPVEESSSEEAVAPSIGTVLVVEDEEGVRSLIKKILQRNGYSILEAADDDTAVKLTLTHEGRIDLLVTDVVMPQTSGLSLADKLKEVRPELKVLFVSGFTDDATITSGLLPPGTAFLQKPFTLSSLLTKVQDVMGLP